VKCIDSCKKFFPDYEIKEWNEDNFDVNINPLYERGLRGKDVCFWGCLGGYVNIASSPAIGENIPFDGHFFSEIVGTLKSQIIINLIVVGYIQWGTIK
jgi:hypothetical protein